MSFQIKKNRRTLLIISALLLIGAGLLSAFTAYGVTRTWDGGGGDANWNTAANWSGDTAPDASDIATFDGTCSSNCSPTVNVAISVAGINMASGYAGTITQSTTNTITVGSSHWVQAAGTFTGGSGAITVNGTFALSGGTFTSTSGTLAVGRPSGGSSETIFAVSGGTFNHNNGTINFNNYGNSGYWAYTVDVQTTLTLYNIIINVGDTNAYLTTASGDTVIAANDFTITDGRLYGTWQVQGNVSIGAGADGGDGTLTMTGTGSKTYTYASGGTGPHLRVNNAALSVSANTGTASLKISLFSLLAGTFTAPTGIMTISTSAAGANIFTVSGGTFNHNNGTVTLNASVSGGYYVFTVDVQTTLTLYNIIINVGDTNSYLTTASGDTVIAANDFTITDGRLYGTWEVQGNVSIGAGADGGDGTLTYTSTNAQTYTDQGGNEPDGDVTINKTSGTVTLASSADWNATSQDLTITSGTLSSATYNITTVNFTVNGGTFTGGSGTVTTTGPLLVSSGTFTGGAGNITVSNTFTLSGGTFTSTSGTMTVGFPVATSNQTVFTVSGGTFNHNNGTILFYSDSSGLSSGFTFTINLSMNVTLYSVIVNAPPGWGGGSAITTVTGGTLIVANNLTLTDGLLNGTWEVQGNVTIATTADGGTGTLTMTGPNDQTYTDQGGNEPDGDITINKTSGTVTLASNADWDATSQDVIITSGILSMGSAYNIATTALTITGGGTLLNPGTGDLTLGGTVANAGRILMQRGSCANTDSVLIRSSVDGTQRSWNGAGTFTLTDVDIKDMAGSASITAYSSTNTGNNGVNWTFNSGCVALPSAASVPSGKFTFPGGKVNFR